MSDGYWVIVIGVWGWVGYISQFGLMSLPIFLVWRELRHISRMDRERFERKARYTLMDRSHLGEDTDLGLSPYLGSLALMLGFNLIDLLPNATLTPTTWLIAGTLFGHAERLARRRKAGNPQTDAAKAGTQTVLKRRTVL